MKIKIPESEKKKVALGGLLVLVTVVVLYKFGEDAAWAVFMILLFGPILWRLSKM